MSEGKRKIAKVTSKRYAIKAHGGRPLPQRAVQLPRNRFDTTCTCCTLILEVEHAFTCPYCGEEISMVLDLSVRRQTYVEDCEVCCNPIEVGYTVQDDTLVNFSAKVLE
jgi:hypothetical protein